jgi:predicted PurR-regulated permease PerM
LADRVPQPADTWLTRERVLVIVLAIFTALVCVLGFQLVLPFVKSITWALVLAVVAHPLDEALRRRLHSPWLAAALSVFIVAVCLATPAVFAVRQIAQEALENAETVRNVLEPARRDALLERIPSLTPLREWLEARDLGTELARLAEETIKGVRGFLAVSFDLALGTLVALFLLFYFLRDRTRMLAAVRAFVPLAPVETDRVVANVGATIRAIVYGTLSVAIVQGTLGGLMFWALGLPAPLLWGTVMGIVSLAPVLGAAIVWVPAALFLAFQGDWTKVIAVVAWGGIVISLIDNLLYPLLVRDRLRLHTVPVFIAVLGGLVVFGVTGIVLGPLVLAVGRALLDIWRRRMRLGEVESGIHRGEREPRNSRPKASSRVT